MIYKMTVPGAKPIYVRADSKPKAVDKVVLIESLTNDQLADALEAGATLWKAGDKIEPETPATPEARPESGAERVNVETGMVEATPPGSSSYQDVRPATIAELTAADPLGQAWRVSAEAGLVQRLPKGEDEETGWQDIREATPEEITAAKPPARRGAK